MLKLLGSQLCALLMIAAGLGCLLGLILASPILLLASIILPYVSFIESVRRGIW